MSETQDSRKRNKKRYMGFKSKRQKGPRELEVGMQGVLITCNMNQRKCTAEAFSLLSEYADQLYGPEKAADSEESGSDADDAEAALQKEVKQMRSCAQGSERRFQALDSGANNVVFIRTQNLDPNRLVHHILEDLHKTKKMKSRVILRMLPVSGTCRAFIEDMERYLSRFLEPWFRTPNQGTFQIVFKARNNSHTKREEVIKVLAGLVGKMNRKNKVDLTNPQYTIIIEVIKTVCCVSVVQDYMLFRKFNLQEVVKLDKAEETLQTTLESQQNPAEEEAKEPKQEEVAEDGEEGPEQEEKKEKVEETISVETDERKEDREDPLNQQ